MANYLGQVGLASGSGGYLGEVDLVGGIPPGSITGLTPGAVLFGAVDTSIGEDPLLFFWDEATERLGLGNNTPEAPLHIGSLGSDRGIAPDVIIGSVAASFLLDNDTTAFWCGLDSGLLRIYARGAAGDFTGNENVFSLTTEGVIRTRAGTADPGNEIYHGGNFLSSNVTAGNPAGGALSTLLDAEIPANMLFNEGDYLLWDSGGLLAASADSQIVVRYGATDVYDSTPVLTTGGFFKLRVKIQLTGSAVQQQVTVELISTDGAFPPVTLLDTAEDASTTLILRVLASATNANAVVQSCYTLEWRPGRVP